MQAGVAVIAVAIAVARLLVHHPGRFGSGLVRVLHNGFGHARIGELLFRQNRGQHFAFGRRRGMEGRCRRIAGGWRSRFLGRPLGSSKRDNADDGQEEKELFHGVILSQTTRDGR